MAVSNPPALSGHPSRQAPSSDSKSTAGTFSRSVGLNPLSTKVTSVLSTSYADPEFRDALALLDDRPALSRADARRQLRLNLQKEVIDSNAGVIREFAKIAEQLRSIGGTLDQLNKTCNYVNAKVTAAEAGTSGVVGKASTLLSQRHQVATKQELLKAFKNHFVLLEEEVACLTQTSEAIDERFFSSLAKAKKISKDCEILLGLEHQTLGLEVMEQVSKSLNLAFQKLYKWLQREFKTLNLENPQMGSSIRHALRVLAERPSLFQSCLDFFAEARESILSDSFHTALTGGSSVGRNHPVKPIELAAHDPLRYVGDMLAWTHSATVGEKEALEMLFVSDGDEIANRIQAGRDNVVWRLIEDEDDAEARFDPAKALNDLVGKSMLGVSRMLRQRVDQITQTNEESILAYKLSTLLDFYRITFAKLLGAGSIMANTLSSLEAGATRQFRSLVRDHVAAVEGEFAQIPIDLGAPEFLTAVLDQLAIIMKTYESSLASAADREVGFGAILDVALNPFLVCCENAAKHVAAPANSIFLINCFSAARLCLSPFDFARTRDGLLQASIETECRKLSDTQYVFLRVSSGIDRLVYALQSQDVQDVDPEKIRSDPAVQPAALALAAQQLDHFLPSALIDTLENVRQLRDSKLARDITEDAIERFCVDFEHVQEVLERADRSSHPMTDDEAEEDHQSMTQQDLRVIFPRTSGEIRVLLS